MLTVINEPTLISQMHQEYFKLINKYHNIKRPGSFIKYYNLDINESPKSKLDTSYDIYTKTNNRWSLFELTPVYMISAIQNSPNNVQDLKGNMIDSVSTITTYTIEEPRINDLITFYKPVESEEVLRVTNVRLQLNAAYATTPIKWFELDVETAPVKYENINKLILNKHFIYDLTQEKNIEYSEYCKFVTFTTEIRELLEKFKPFYSPVYDVYHLNGQIIREFNELIFFIRKKYTNDFNRLFEGMPTPYGYWDRYKFIYSNIDEINFSYINLINIHDSFESKVLADELIEIQDIIQFAKIIITKLKEA